MKRILCLLLAVIMTLNVGVMNVSASETGHKRDGRGEWRQEDYERVNHTLNYLGYDEDDTVYYTEFQETVKEENKVKYVSFIYDDERAIGQYIKEETDDDVNECFIINKDSQIMKELVAHLDGDEFDVKDEEINSTTFALEATATDGASNKGWQTVGSGSARYIMSYANTGKFLEADFVGNDTNPNTGYGLCWAACGASVSNYYRNTTYSASDVFKIVQTATGVTNPTGIPATVKCMYSKLGIYYTYLTRRLTYSQALLALNKDTMIMYGVQKVGEGSHAVILCGVFRINSYYGFIYMDPNVSDGYVINYNDKAVANSTSGNFYYYAGDILYDTVFCTFYNLEKHYTVN